MTPDTALHPPSGCYQADRNHTSVIWRIKHLGLAWYTGRFTRFKVDVSFDSSRVEASTVRAEVDLRSVRTEYQESDKDWDRELADKPEFLDAKLFPTATFESVQIEPVGGDCFRMSGNLDFRGIVRPLVFAVQYNGNVADHASGRPMIGFSAQATLRRSEHGLTFFLGPLMPDDVQILIEAELALTPWPTGAQP